ncbi:MAG TPA: PP2C family protein-serine/threonine phosphatase [Phycisphaerales bacterium]|nr:PP2C family protein-serine/threonine phosphatase [Phycisphaerales bacterium]
MTQTFTSDFKHEYHAELAHFLRRRFLWYSGVTGGLLALSFTLTLAYTFYYWLGRPAYTRPELVGLWIKVTSGAITTSMYLWSFFQVRRNRFTREQLLKFASWLIFIAGTVVLLLGVLNVEVLSRLEGGEKIGENKYLIGFSSAFNILVYHLFACLFLPWTAKESLKPIWPLLVLNAVIALIYAPGAWVFAIVTIVLSPLVALPGVGICVWRQGRFKESFTFKMLKSRYGEIRQELHSARQIHESLFPKPIEEGPVCFTFRYEPMRQIGGDYLYVRQVKLPGRLQSALNIVLVDVTGHGITAALTVNRLHGEIEREFGENAATSPGELLVGLNAYLHHTLAQHSVYATVLCCRIDPDNDEIVWASAGHPPAFLRAVDGTVERMDSTTFVLGACRGNDFIPDEKRMRFGPGDRAILYTDGAIEARGANGRMLTVAGMEKLVAMAKDTNRDGVILDELLAELERFRSGPAADDTLLVEVVRPV